MRIALITNLLHDQLGLFYVSASLKRAGHEVRYFLYNRRLEKELKRFSPGLVGFSTLTGNHLWAKETALYVKSILPEVKTILGGAHATYYPEIINEPGFDFICRGEGELPVVKLANALEKGEDVSQIEGIWVKEGERIYKNPFAPLVENLDTLPFPDRSIYELFPFSSFHRFYPFIMSSRGCPYKCTFCFEPVYRDLVKGKGRYVRYRSVASVVQEALDIKERYRVRSFEFVDDIFGMKREWLREFASMWKKEVRMPFHCNMRTDMIDEEVACLLKEGGCISVAIGVESGNQRVRNYIFMKETTEESIHNACEILKKKGIKIITYNIIGAPGERYEDVWDTLHVNQRIKADYASVSLFQPYPGTYIYNNAIKEGILNPEDAEDVDKFPLTFHDSLPVKNLHRKELINLQKIFNIGVWFPWTEGIIRFLVKLPVNPLFYLIFILLHAYGLWFRVKKVPALFIVNLLINVRGVFKKQKALIAHSS